MTWLLMALATAAPLQLTWQTRLVDSAGAPVNGSHSVEIELWTAESDGTELWDDTFPLSVNDGYASVRLGSQEALTTAVFSGGELWVQHRVDGVEVQPRQLLASVPFALQAGSVPSVAAVSDTDCTGQPGRVAWESSSSSLRVCDGTQWNTVIMGRTIVDQAGARQYSDGTAAASCRDYRNPGNGALYVGSVGDGLYWIDPDGVGPGPAFQAWCDMTTDGGGWTQLHLLPDATAEGLVFADQNACGDSSLNVTTINEWGFGDIITSGEPSPGSANCFAVDGNGVAPEQQVFELTYYSRDGVALSSSQTAAFASTVSTTVYDGDHYHNDIDAPGISEPVGPYGETGTGPRNDGGGGYVIFPSRTADPSSGADFYITDNDNPHLTTGGSTEHEVLDWETIAHGFVSHLGVQGRSNDTSAPMTWSGPNADGGGRGILTSSWVWVR